MGLFGSVNVQAKTAEWYRSQLTAEEMAMATAKKSQLSSASEAITPTIEAAIAAARG